MKPCTDNPAPFDRLIDLHSPSRTLSREERTNAQAALTMCLAGNDGKPCPIRGKCWADNASEPWVESMRLELTLPPMKPRARQRVTPCATCGRGHYGKRDLCRGCWRQAHALTPDDPRHGSPRGYKAHKTRDEDPCEPCRDAWKAYLRDRRVAA